MMEIEVVGGLDLTALQTYDPDLPKEGRPPETATKKDAFYAASVAGPKQDVEINYEQIKNDLGRFGTSPIVEQLKDNWKAAKRSTLEAQIEETLFSPTLSNGEKREQILAIDAETRRTPTTEELYKEKLKNEEKERREKEHLPALPMEIEVTGGIEEPSAGYVAQIKDFFSRTIDWQGIRQYINTDLDKDVVEGRDATLSVLADFAVALPAGLAKFYKLLVAEDVEAAKELQQKILDWAYTPDSEGAEQKKEAILEFLAPLGGYSEKIFNQQKDALLKQGASPHIAEMDAMITSLIEDPINWMLGGIGASRMRKAKEAGEPLSEKVWRDKDSALDVTEQISTSEAADLASKAIKNPKMAEAMGTTPASIAQRNLLPKDAVEDVKKIYPDIAQYIEKSDRQTLYYFDLMKVSPYLFDIAAIKKDVDLHYKVMHDTSELDLNLASSTFEDTGRALRGKAVYGKSPNTGFVDDVELIEAINRTTNTIAQKMGITQNQARNQISVFTDPKTFEQYIAWEFFKAYDPVVDTFLGGNPNTAKFGLGFFENSSNPLANTGFGKFFKDKDVSAFANSIPGQLIYDPASRLPEFTTAGFARASMMATHLEKVWNDTMRNEILVTKPRQELAKAIYKTEELGRYLPVQELRELFPLMPSSDFKSLVNGYVNYRRLVDYSYMVANEIYRSQKLTAGMKGIYDEKGRYVDNLGKPLKADPDYIQDGVLISPKKEFVDSFGVMPEEVYSFRLVKDAEGSLVHEGPIKVSSFDVQNTEIYKLDKSIKKDKQVYEYAVGLTEGPIPDSLLPNIPGYYPHINREPYFIKAIPKELTINGRRLTRDDKTEHIFQAHASTVGVERTQKLADEYAARLSRENEDFTYAPVFERTMIDDNLSTSLDMVRYSQDVAKSRRAERLTYSDGVTFGRLEDPAVALDIRLNQLARLWAWKDIDFEYRQRYLESFGKFSEGKFPQTITDIKPLQNMSPEAEASLNHAKVLFQQYAKQQRPKETFLEPIWQSKTLQVGRWMEEVTPLSRWADAVKDLSKTRDPLFSSVLKLSTLKYIHWNPQRQWIVQPSQLYELHALAAANGNLKFSADMVGLSMPIFADAVLRSSRNVPQSLKDALKKYGGTPRGYTAKEFKEITDAFFDTGIPHSIDMQAVVDGVFRSAGDALDVSDAMHSWQRAKSLVSGTVQIPKAVGFTPAELMNQLGIWLYARSEFMRTNPGKKWNDPHNLEIITSRAWGIGNTMTTRASLLPYQEGAARGFLQFQAYANKSIMQPFNSKFLTPKERLRLAAIRGAMWGTKGVLGSAALLYAVDKAREATRTDEERMPGAVGEDTTYDEVMELAHRGLADRFINKMINSWLGPDVTGAETDLMISKSMAPGTETTLPLGDFIRNMIEIIKGETPISRVAPFIPAVTAVFDVANIFWDSMYSRAWEGHGEAEAIKYILKTAEFASGYSNFEKSLAMLQHQSVVDKHLNSKEIAVTAIEARAKFFGVTSAKEDVMYVVGKGGPRLQKEIQATAKKIVASYYAIASINADSKSEDGIKELGKRVDEINHLVSIYAPVGLEEELTDAVWKQINMEGGGFDKLVAKLLDRQSIMYDNQRLEMAKQLQKMAEHGDEKTKKLIEALFVEIDNMDKE